MIHHANHITRMPLHLPGDCTHRVGFTRPIRVPLPRTGRGAIVATCIGCGRAYFVLHGGAVRRMMEGVKATLYHRDQHGGERARINGHGGPDSSVCMATRKDG